MSKKSIYSFLTTYAIIAVLFALFLLSFVPIEYWGYQIQYFFKVPVWTWIGQGWFYWLIIFFLTVVVRFIWLVFTS